MIKTWKGKPTDLLLTLVYFILYGSGIHILVAIKHAVKHHKPIIHAITDPSSIILSFFLLFFVLSPVWVYFRKVPRLLKLDPINQKLEIQKRRKTLRYNTDKIRFYKRITKFFYILEIHATFHSSRNGEFEKMATSIIVPNWGLSWNKKKMDEIVQELKAMQVEEITSRPHIPIHEYFYN